MPAITRFENLDAWKEARCLANEIYCVSRTSPFAADFALRDQIRKSAISIPSNVAEGFERDGNTEFIHFLSVAKGSCGELRTQLYLALDCGYLDEKSFRDLFDHAERMSRIINGLMTYLKRSDFRGRKKR